MPLVVLSEKVQPDVLELWKKSKEESEAQTGNQFVELILEKYLNPKVRTVEIVKRTIEDEQEIQNLTNELGRLKTLLTFKDETIESHELTLKQLGDKVASMVDNVPNVPILENQVILNLSPKVLEVAKIEAAAAEKQTKKPFSLEDVFTQNFWASIVEGKAYPWRVWSNSEISAIEKRIAKESQPSQ